MTPLSPTLQQGTPGGLWGGRVVQAPFPDHPPWVSGRSSLPYQGAPASPIRPPLVCLPVDLGTQLLDMV